MKIAVFVDELGMTAPLGESGFVNVFTREEGAWRICQRIPFSLPSGLTLNQIRQRTLSMLAELPYCRHFVASEIHGALLAWLDGMGMTMWKTRGRPEDFLDRIVAQIPPAPESVTVLPPVSIVPAEEEGAFRLDLFAALQIGGAHTSKRLLMPFFQLQTFSSLEIHCDHLPKWFSELDTARFAWRIIPHADGTLSVIVEPVR
ncbi:Fe-only nitrogenase accessory protein AnfO [Raoultella terrigena]|uniref:Fe-only nitrogenase accessory protein AnfO n=1 Tax=Raoultella terrigena TaxID=577 RepID=A0A3P8M0X0_RAOTE|nr:Fe-only nitrogenase accessory protein AnfO [Raoultella terrigena]